MIRQFAIGLAISIASLSLCLVGIEVVLRLPALQVEAPRSTRLDTVSTTPMKVPDLRQPRDRIDPKGEAFRIVVVGDSFSWGDGVHSEDAFPFRLENQLNLQMDENLFEVVNWPSL